MYAEVTSADVLLCIASRTNRRSASVRNESIMDDILLLLHPIPHFGVCVFLKIIFPNEWVEPSWPKRFPPAASLPTNDMSTEDAKPLALLLGW